MVLSISHEVAECIDYGNRLLQRLKRDGRHLSEMEMRILSEQLRQLGATVKELDGTNLSARSKEAS
jgi:hypothetical protein